MMKLTRSLARLQRAFVLGCAAVLAAQGALAQEAYPSRPVRLIVPFAAGGTADVVARVVGAKLGERLGQPVIIENRGGAGSITGTDAGAKAPADGYTLTITNGAAVTTGPLLGQRMPYKPLEDFVHVFLIGTFPNMLVVRTESPAKSLQDFLARARKERNGVSWGSAGVGSAGYLAGELLQQLAKVPMVHVPYKGTGPAMNDLLGGTIDAMLTSPAVAAPHIRSGKLRALGVSSSKRLSDFPDVPAMQEVVPGAVGDAWFGVSVPAKTPPAIVERLRAELERVLRAPELRSQLHEAGLTPAALGPVEFEKFLRQEVAKWTPVIRTANISLD
ncbi:Bug family tripartite tricarboxylate transporter substrate binding protein [Roseateles violae]|uniref:Tripartite tricarboxylate transporter substrate binding protein n=1 Tax=Roseateles violae TaxID=3058042 RepID=A0ABT8DPL4_9BURK|nr:tripartite tricarboxylate transporter substrate binding protein [Pelomonas sp. PFR6]MDN3920292.1 tripartite tricarboxylate transporter substrate binding protein [Pelomonas sp. PFR6]